MAAYTKLVNFASKDNLLSGNPLKVVTGAELDAEFNAIATSSVQSYTAITTAETNAAASATAAAASATTATTQASNASTSASTATTQASNASTSATNAATSATNASNSATTATTQASNASTSASAAATSATNASTSASAAATSATNASTSATNAATSETNAAASAAKLSGTSTTSLAIETGSKVFTTQSGKFFEAGRWLLATSDANPTNYMHGQVTSYSGTTLTLNVTNIGGSGTLADWTITISGTRGATGATGATGAQGPQGNPGTGITPQAVGWTGTGGTTPKTLTVDADFTVSNALVSGGALGTPSSGTLTNCTGLPIGGTTGYGTGVATALAVNVGSAGAPVVNGGALGTPSSGNLGSCTAYPSSALAGVPLTPQATGFTATGGTTPKTLTVDDDITTSQAARRNAANTFTAQQTFAEVKDTVYTITDGAAFEIDPVNGSIQTVTLGASRTPAATNFEAGQTVLLGIDDGTAYSITWTTVNPTWVKAGGTAAAPTLATSGYTWILLTKIGSTIYAAEWGKP